MDSQMDRLRVEICERFQVNEDYVCARKEVILETLDYIDER
jgi:hypothetical protein